MNLLRSYLIKSTYNFLIDLKLTPLVLVDLSFKNIIMPNFLMDGINDNRILFNLSLKAVDDLMFDDFNLKFNACFNGDIYCISFPVQSIVEIYAKEIFKGLYFGSFDKVAYINEGKDIDRNKLNNISDLKSTFKLVK